MPTPSAHQARRESRTHSVYDWLNDWADDWAYVDPSVPRAKELGDKYEQRFKRKVDVFVAQGYDALHVLAKAIAEAGQSTAERAKIAQAIRAIKYQGAVGDVTFDDNGQNVRKIFIARLEGGKFNVVK